MSQSRYGAISKFAGALVKPFAVTVNERLPVGNPSGSRTIMNEPVRPVTPVIGPIHSMGKLTPLACTNRVTDDPGIGGDVRPRFDVNSVIRV